jgi:hypothetical protein
MFNRGIKEYHDREEWEFHIKGTHLLYFQYACSFQGPPTSLPLLITGCEEMFTTNTAMKEHYSEVHAKGMSPTVNNGKRKSLGEDVVRPIIEAMPAEIARRYRPVYDGPSRTISIGQDIKLDRERKRRKS